MTHPSADADAALRAHNLRLTERNSALEQEHRELDELAANFDLTGFLVDQSQRVQRALPKLGTPDLEQADLASILEALGLQLDRAALRDELAEVLEGGSGADLEMQDQRGLWYTLRVRPYRGNAHAGPHACVTLLNIDPLKRRIALANRATADAERLNLIKDEFLSMLSHELRTPLASVLMHTQLLRQNGLSARNAGRALEAIERGTQQQTRLIDDLVDASYIIAGDFKLNCQAFELRPVIEDALESVREASAAKGIVLEAAVDDDVGRVWADPIRVRKVAVSLLTNAIKFTGPAGRIFLRLGVADGMVELQVKDTGCGIDAEFMEHIFDRLAQQDGSIVRRYGGLGLGLAITRRVIELLGGTVRAESAGLGLGATFTVRFPALAAGRHEPAEAPAPSRPGPLDRPGRTREYAELRDLTILVVEDDSATREAIVEVLRLAGADVRAAASAAQAMRELDGFMPRVVVSDIAMPDEDGYSFMRRLRSRDPQGNQLRAIALTALSTEKDRQRAKAAGFHAHLSKPVDIDRLRDAVVALVTKLTASPS